ncbi:MAG: autotransporter outer membrane beta-barrel domain-containing protein [Deltaproteobacteria bacterium]|nr:autotransporter outer membrane beta-barrel domain-containing protein [Deltaproteobacteria bacterium]
MRKLLLVGLVSGVGLIADTGKDVGYQVTIGFDFFQPSFDARTTALAGSNQFTSLASNLVASNPANTGLMKDAHVSAAYSHERISWEDVDVDDFQNNTGHVYASLPVGPYVDALPDYGNVTVGWVGDWAEWDSGSDFVAADLEYTNHGFTLGYAKALGDSWALGYAVTYFQGEGELALGAVDPLTGTVQVVELSTEQDTLRHNLGALFKVGEKTHVGFGGYYSHSIDEEISVDAGVVGPGGGWYFGGRAGNSFDLTSWGLGLGVEHTYDFGLTTAAGLDYANYDIDSDDGRAYNIRVGAEYPLGETVVLRAGYRYFAGSDFDEAFESDANVKFNAASGGFGVNFANWGSLNYGVEYRHIGDGDFTHTVSYDVPFSICE